MFFGTALLLVFFYVLLAICACALGIHMGFFKGCRRKDKVSLNVKNVNQSDDYDDNLLLDRIPEKTDTKTESRDLSVSMTSLVIDDNSQDQSDFQDF